MDGSRAPRVPVEVLLRAPPTGAQLRWHVAIMRKDLSLPGVTHCEILPVRCTRSC